MYMLGNVVSWMKWVSFNIVYVTSFVDCFNEGVLQWTPEYCRDPLTAQCRHKYQECKNH